MIDASDLGFFESYFLWFLFYFFFSFLIMVFNYLAKLLNNFRTLFRFLFLRILLWTVFFKFFLVTIFIWVRIRAWNMWWDFWRVLINILYHFRGIVFIFHLFRNILFFCFDIELIIIFTSPAISSSIVFFLFHVSIFL